MENELEKKKPCAEVSSGPVRAAIWKNETENGPRYSFSLSRSYRNEDNQPRFSRSFELEHITAIMMCMNFAIGKIQDLEDPR